MYGECAHYLVASLHNNSVIYMSIMLKNYLNVVGYIALGTKFWYDKSIRLVNKLIFDT